MLLRRRARMLIDDINHHIDPASLVQISVNTVSQPSVKRKQALA
jgi:hypothetical protein